MLDILAAFRCTCVYDTKVPHYGNLRQKEGHKGVQLSALSRSRFDAVLPDFPESVQAHSRQMAARKGHIRKMYPGATANERDLKVVFNRLHAAWEL